MVQLDRAKVQLRNGHAKRSKGKARCSRVLHGNGRASRWTAEAQFRWEELRQSSVLRCGGGASCRRAKQWTCVVWHSIETDSHGMVSRRNGTAQRDAASAKRRAAEEVYSHVWIGDEIAKQRGADCRNGTAAPGSDIVDHGDEIEGYGMVWQSNGRAERIIATGRLGSAKH